MTLLRSVCVFCGSNPGSDPVYLAAAKDVGTRLAMDGLVLVYGGARVGLMGAVADAALAAGGRVSGVIPKALVDKELAHDGLSELHTVSSMHERKALMAMSPVAGVYDDVIDRESAFEILKKRADAAAKAEAEQQELEARQKEQEALQRSRARYDDAPRSSRSTSRRRTSSRQSVTEAAIKSVTRSVASSLGRALVRGILGSIKKGF